MTRTVLSTPYRSPLSVVEKIKDIIKDKVVCDLGCACGDLMVEMQKYAKEVIGVEIDRERFEQCQRKGLNVIWGDVFKMEIPKADVYYVWLENKLTPQIPQIMKPGTWILAADPSILENMEINKLCLPGQWIGFNYNEGFSLRQNGLFMLFVTEVK